MKLNPFTKIIEETKNDPVQIQERYEEHRQSRNHAHRKLLLSPSFTGVHIDTILQRLLAEREKKSALNSSTNHVPAFVDERICLSVYARPPTRVQHLIQNLQHEIRKLVPDVRCPEPTALHVTVLEVASSMAPETVQPTVEGLRPCFNEIVNYCAEPAHHTRLSHPMVVFDASGIALSFLPSQASRSSDENAVFTYHHLRRDIYDLVTPVVELKPRYIVPSCHITIARYVQEIRPEVLRGLVIALQELNVGLQKRYWAEDKQHVSWDARNPGAGIWGSEKRRE